MNIDYTQIGLTTITSISSVLFFVWRRHRKEMNKIISSITDLTATIQVLRNEIMHEKDAIKSLSNSVYIQNSIIRDCIEKIGIASGKIDVLCDLSKFNAEDLQ